MRRQRGPGAVIAGWVGTVAVALLLLEAALIGGAASAWAQQKFVFAHYMVCCPRGSIDAEGQRRLAPTVDDFVQDIREASEAGIDGFALNCGEWNGHPRYKAYSKALFEAAQRFGPKFKLFFSADDVTAEEAADMVVTYGDHPNQLRRDGRPVLSSFGGSNQWVLAIRRQVRERAAKEIFVIPYFYPPSFHEIPNSLDLAILGQDNPDIDGFFYFGAAGGPDELAGAIRRHADEWSRRGKLFMAGITAYYRGFRTNYRVFENRGFDSLVKQWMAAIESDTEWVELVTWNDWSEASYLSALSAAGDKTRSVDLWGPLLTHEGFLGASRHFIDWFKSGREPAIEQERVFYAYRLHRKYALGRQDPTKPGTSMPRGMRSLIDRVHVLTMLRKPADLVIRVGSGTERIRVEAGVRQASVRMRSGAVGFELMRDGVVLAAKAGEFPVSATDAWSNFDMLSGVLTVAR